MEIEGGSIKDSSVRSRKCRECRRIYYDYCGGERIAVVGVQNVSGYRSFSCLDIAEALSMLESE